MARPRIDPREQHCERVVAYLTADELATLEMFARSEGVALAVAARMLIRDALMHESRETKPSLEGFENAAKTVKQI